jgi:hypothetical protein
VTEKLGGHPKGGNSLKSPQEIRTRSDAHGSINIQEGQPIDFVSVLVRLGGAGMIRFGACFGEFVVIMFAAGQGHESRPQAPEHVSPRKFAPFTTSFAEHVQPVNALARLVKSRTMHASICIDPAYVRGSESANCRKFGLPRLRRA